MKKIALVSAAAVVLFLPESNRFDLLVVAAVVYAAAFYLVRCLCGVHERMHRERNRLNGLRWVRRNPPALVDMQGRTEYPVVYEEPGYILFEQIRKGA